MCYTHGEGSAQQHESANQTLESDVLSKYVAKEHRQVQY